MKQQAWTEVKIPAYQLEVARSSSDCLLGSNILAKLAAHEKFTLPVVSVDPMEIKPTQPRLGFSNKINDKITSWITQMYGVKRDWVKYVSIGVNKIDTNNVN